MTPSRDLELRLLAGRPGGLIAGIDEVGRGALAGPVSVGIAVVDAGVGAFPEGLRDSKQLSHTAREALVPRVTEWVRAVSVGHAGPDVVDRVGIISALRYAAADAVARLPIMPDLAILDGSHNWWEAAGLFDPPDLLPLLPITMEVKADASSAVVAAASVVAKVARDSLMVDLDAEHPGYDWARNKGYSSPSHIRALGELGPSPLHRVSWNLPGLGEQR